MALLPGTRLGPYEIGARLGAGGMGEVYRAIDSRLGRAVAIKVIRAEGGISQDRLHRFEREARAAAAISHPNVCAVHDIGTHEGLPFVVMELLEGKSLRQLLTNGPLPLSEALGFGQQAAEGLIAAHARGIVHRDLKPENLFVTTGNQVKLLDFGLAKLTRDDDVAALAVSSAGDSATTLSGTRPGALLGTCAYMAPEQILGGKVDARCDIFSMGVILFELVAGRRPFGGEGAIEKLHAILHDAPESLAVARAEAPAPLARLVHRCLARDPERRLQTAKDLRNELDEIRQEVDGGTARASVVSTSSVVLVDHEFVLSSAMVRELAEPSPRLVGYPMSWTDNGVSSDTLVVLLLGQDCHDLTPVNRLLRQSPWRMVVPVLAGFGKGAAFRPALGIEDHSRLLRHLLREIVRILRPAHTILAGVFRLGADHFLRMASDEAAGGAGIEVDGLLTLGGSVSAETLALTRTYRRLVDDDEQRLLTALKRFGEKIDSLPAWIAVQNYSSQIFVNLGTNLGPLQRYCADMVEPFEQPGDPVADWYRSARRSIPHIRLVFSNDEAGAAEALLARHLESNVLGDDFDERNFVIEPIPHVALLDPDLIVRHIEALAREITGPAAKPSPMM